MFQSLISNPVTRAYIAAAIRHALTYGGGILSTYLLSKGASSGDVSNLVEGLIGAGMAVTSIAFSMMDVKKVDSKVSAAIALAPQSPPEVVQALKDGHF